MNLSEAFTDYINNKVIAAGLSDATAENYRMAKLHAVRFFGNKEITDITVDELALYFANLRATLAANTARNYCIQLRSVLDYENRRGRLSLPLDLIPIPKPAKTAPEWLSWAQTADFVEAVGRKKRGYNKKNRIRNVIIAKMLFETGCRVSEICALDRDSIRDGEFVVIGKSKLPRTCFVSKGLEDEINAYLKTRTDGNRAMFISYPSSKRVTRQTVERVFRRVSAENGWRVHPHTLRHSFATYMLNSGVDIRSLAEMLGHQSIQTTQIYTHVTSPKLRRIHGNTMRHL